MRNTKIALAVLALVASTAATAEGVTVYGTADVSVVRTDVGTSMAGAGNSAGSIFGVKGSDDLGGGLKASFNLETGYTGTNGALANGGALGNTVIFNRQANVGLSNENAGITLGTQLSPFIAGELNGATKVGGNGVFVPGLLILNGGNLAGTTQSAGGFFIPDAVSVSASFSGVSANVLQRTRSANSAATGGLTSDKYMAANIGGSVADISLNVAYQNINTGTVETTNTVFSANTTIQGISINGAYASNKISNVSNKGYLFGASMPLVGALSAGLTYARNDLATLGNMKSVSLQYTLSKASYVYLNYNTFSVDTTVAGNDSGNLGTANKTSAMTAVGIASSF
jgi:predicted porin